jgi:hypothetical protein
MEVMMPKAIPVPVRRLIFSALEEEGCRRGGS